MDRRNFLMRLAATFATAIVVRPTLDDVINFNPVNKQLQFYGGAAGGGKSEYLFNMQLEFIGKHGFVVEAKPTYKVISHAIGNSI